MAFTSHISLPHSSPYAALQKPHSPATKASPPWEPAYQEPPALYSDYKNQGYGAVPMEKQPSPSYYAQPMHHSGMHPGHYKSHKETCIRLESGRIAAHTAVAATCFAFTGLSFGLGAPLFVPIACISLADAIYSGVKIARKKKARRRGM